MDMSENESTPPEISLNQVFGQNLRTLRDGLGWSRSKLAERMKEEGFPKYSHVTVSRTEDGKRAAKVEEAFALAHVLGVTLEDLLSREMEMPSDVRKHLNRTRQASVDAAASFAKFMHERWMLTEVLRQGRQGEGRFHEEPRDMDQADEFLATHNVSSVLYEAMTNDDDLMYPVAEQEVGDARLTQLFLDYNREGHQFITFSKHVVELVQDDSEMPIDSFGAYLRGRWRRDGEIVWGRIQDWPFDTPDGYLR